MAAPHRAAGRWSQARRRQRSTATPPKTTKSTKAAWRRTTRSASSWPGILLLRHCGGQGRVHDLPLPDVEGRSQFGGDADRLVSPQAGQLADVREGDAG